MLILLLYDKRIGSLGSYEKVVDQYKGDKVKYLTFYGLPKNLYSEEFLNLLSLISRDSLLDLHINLADIDVERFLSLSGCLNSKNTTITYTANFSILRSKDLDLLVNNYHKIINKGLSIRMGSEADPRIGLDNYAQIREEIMFRNDITYSDELYYGEYKGKIYPDSYTEEELIGYNISSRYAQVINPQNPIIKDEGYNLRITRDGDVQSCRDVWDLKGDIVDKLGNVKGDIKWV